MVTSVAGRCKQRMDELEGASNGVVLLGLDRCARIVDIGKVTYKVRDRKTSREADEETLRAL